MRSRTIHLAGAALAIITVGTVATATPVNGRHHHGRRPGDHRPGHGQGRRAAPAPGGSKGRIGGRRHESGDRHRRGRPFTFSSVPPGEYQITASIIGRRAGTMDVTVVAGETARVNLQLDPEPVTLDELVVTGTILPTAVREVPTPITIVNRET